MKIEAKKKDWRKRLVPYIAGALIPLAGAGCNTVGNISDLGRGVVEAGLSYHNRSLQRPTPIEAFGRSSEYIENDSNNKLEVLVSYNLRFDNHSPDRVFTSNLSTPFLKKNIERVADYSVSNPVSQIEDMISNIPEVESDIDPEYDERENPGAYKLGEGSERLELAKAVFAEARGFYRNSEALRLVANSILTRAELTGKSVREEISKSKTYKSGKTVYAYTFFNPDDPNRDNAENPLVNPNEAKAWYKIYDLVSEIYSNYEKGNFKPRVTHYWTDQIVDEPEWAQGREPVASLVCNQGRTTRFYYMPGDFKRVN